MMSRMDWGVGGTHIVTVRDSFSGGGGFRFTSFINFPCYDGGHVMSWSCRTTQNLYDYVNSNSLTISPMGSTPTDFLCLIPAKNLSQKTFSSRDT